MKRRSCKTRGKLGSVLFVPIHCPLVHSQLLSSSTYKRSILGIGSTTYIPLSREKIIYIFRQIMTQWHKLFKFWTSAVLLLSLQLFQLFLLSEYWLCAAGIKLQKWPYFFLVSLSINRNSVVCPSSFVFDFVVNKEVVFGIDHW